MVNIREYLRSGGKVRCRVDGMCIVVMGLSRSDREFIRLLCRVGVVWTCNREVG